MQFIHKTFTSYEIRRCYFSHENINRISLSYHYLQNAKTNTNNLKTNKKQINNIKQINKNLGDIKGSRYIVLLFYKIVAVESKGRKKKKKPHSGEVDNKSYPKRKLQRIEIDNGSVNDNEFESEPSDQSELFAGEKTIKL